MSPLRILRTLLRWWERRHAERVRRYNLTHKPAVTTRRPA